VPKLAGIPVYAIQIAMKIVTGEVIFEEHMHRILERLQNV
jgi:hypothetical protein